MSSDDLPNKLDKLEIQPTLPQVKLLDRNLPLHFNPFYNDELTIDAAEIPLRLNGSQISRSQERYARSLTCRKCRPRRWSESVVDDYKVTTAPASDYAEASLSTSNAGSLRKPIKKTLSSARRYHKILIREPVLEALHSYFPSHSSSRRRFVPAISDDSSAAGSTQTTEASIVGRSMSDFRDLIAECTTLLEHNVDIRGRLNQSSRRDTKNFTTFQVPTPKSRPHFSSADVAGRDSGNGLANRSITSSNTSPSSELSTTSRSSTSCSQQAGNSTVSDDVTIDELASYFDTLVHIPKKMSTMAEMMYT